ncbi:MAG: anthranilate phosphoribosyltransferase [Gammaproteobacteria bacterium]|jgi:anthranilate phosphoribosyltransferase|nr:anthranilate phosphoribosyltransferase [Chromatiales bacterium]MCP4926688.1 anthranilate phosphoribosyltransferase [Gammaproteobacteria bacterium]MDP7153469.1 anthranilate phosphoribosyltransferase [Gammaproteobacteria bacterium]MDP7295977.1 anthranilate phosphoribosyltransferase [Gammaproteobacteria bacterium]MDP7418463.1 anthranilate phosphoribosyltransferase [Gammaproteobacteria bacterium]
MAIDAHQTLNRLLANENLAEVEAADLMRLLTDEALPQVMSAALLIALRAKGETADEVRGFALAMRELAQSIILPDDMQAVDIVGTGGDGSGSVNISTGTALLAAASGLPVVKHGNRSVSSKSGSADVLEALGIPIPADPKATLACVADCGFTFLFAPFFHPAMKAIAPVRGALGVRTVFNILGPLTNPARPPYHLVGAFDLPTAQLMADALVAMPIKRAFVIHGEPGWDEATPVGRFTLFDVQPGEVIVESRDPLDYGMARCSPQDLAGGDAGFNATALEAVLNGADQGPHRDALVLGAGLALELAGRAGDLHDGIAQGYAALDSGAAQQVLTQLRAFTA